VLPGCLLAAKFPGKIFLCSVASTNQAIKGRSLLVNRRAVKAPNGVRAASFGDVKMASFMLESSSLKGVDV
jgi:hypothetical protein